MACSMVNGKRLITNVYKTWFIRAPKLANYAFKNVMRLQQLSSINCGAKGIFGFLRVGRASLPTLGSRKGKFCPYTFHEEFLLSACRPWCLSIHWHWQQNFMPKFMIYVWSQFCQFCPSWKLVISAQPKKLHFSQWMNIIVWILHPVLDIGTSTEPPFCTWFLPAATPAGSLHDKWTPVKELMKAFRSQRDMGSLVIEVTELNSEVRRDL